MRHWTKIRDAVEEVAGLVLTEHEARRIGGILATAPPPYEKDGEGRVRVTPKLSRAVLEALDYVQTVGPEALEPEGCWDSETPEKASPERVGVFTKLADRLGLCDAGEITEDALVDHVRHLEDRARRSPFQALTPEWHSLVLGSLRVAYQHGVITQSECDAAESTLSDLYANPKGKDRELLEWSLSEFVEIFGICGNCQIRPNTKSFTFRSGDEEEEGANPYVFGVCCDECLPAVETERGATHVGFQARDMGKAPIIRELIVHLGWPTSRGSQ